MNAMVVISFAAYRKRRLSRFSQIAYTIYNRSKVLCFSVNSPGMGGTWALSVNFSGSKISDIAKVPLRLFDSHSYLTGAAATGLRPTPAKYNRDVLWLTCVFTAAKFEKYRNGVNWVSILHPSCTLHIPFKCRSFSYTWTPFVISMPADDLPLDGARPSAGTVPIAKSGRSFQIHRISWFLNNFRRPHNDIQSGR